MEKFTKTLDTHFSGPGIKLKQRVCAEVEYYNETQKNVAVKEIVCANKNGFSQTLIAFSRASYKCICIRMEIT